MPDAYYDAIIIGAGISGISAAYHFQRYTKNKTYKILERRQNLGGTWDLFNYPGIRSDSDMYTFGFNFRHWDNECAIAEKSKILEYLNSTVQEFGIDKHIDYGRHITSADWNSKTSRWLLSSTDGEKFTCQFLFMCAGYYDYDKAHNPAFIGIENYKGKVVHPQFWPDELDYTGKKVVIIGSGATAVTLLPAMADKTEHITMLQRSPTYMGSKPAISPVANKLASLFGRWAARWWFILTSMLLYSYCKTFPAQAKQRLVQGVAEELGEKFDARHFTPTYKPWDQRVCLCPDGDFFNAIKSGQASVETDHIERFTENGLLLKSGKTLDADIVVTATGLTISLMGGMSLTVDGETVCTGERYVYRGLMLSGVPNTFVSIGYTNASWTLKVDLANRYATRLINKMDNNGCKKAVAYPQGELDEIPFLDLASGYITRAANDLPKQAKTKPWKLNQNFILDNLLLRLTRVDDEEMHFS
ncbi:MAG: NAD(P)/FAD-dependent oxidoreductase [Pseudomonadales bacterium]